MKIIGLLCILVLLQKQPVLNIKVIDFVNQSMNKTVGTGECWDLAAAGLDFAGAYLDRSSEKTIYIFGEEIDPGESTIFPGDIIQMKNVKIQYLQDNALITEFMDHHTAIVYKVHNKGEYTIAHQNTSFGGRKVAVSEFNLKNVKSGKVYFYRPISK